MTDSQPESKHVVILLHGIRTRGKWQKDITSWLSKEGFVVEPLDYGFFRALWTLVPNWRRAQVDWLRDEMDKIKNKHAGYRVSVIAHSLGSYLTARLLEIYFGDHHFCRIILCGSIVRVDFPWKKLCDAKLLEGLLNEYGALDWVSTLASWVIADAGDSGRKGFTIPDGFTGVQQRGRREFRHSDYFYETNFRTWIAYLRSGKISPLSEFPKAHRNLKFATFAIAALSLLVVAGGFGYCWMFSCSCDEAAFDRSYVPSEISIERSHLPATIEVEQKPNVMPESVEMTIVNETGILVHVILVDAYRHYFPNGSDADIWPKTLEFTLCPGTQKAFDRFERGTGHYLIYLITSSNGTPVFLSHESLFQTSRPKLVLRSSWTIWGRSFSCAPDFE